MCTLNPSCLKKKKRCNNTTTFRCKCSIPRPKKKKIPKLNWVSSMRRPKQLSQLWGKNKIFISLVYSSVYCSESQSKKKKKKVNRKKKKKKLNKIRTK